MKWTSKSIQSLPQRLSNATLSGGVERPLPGEAVSNGANQIRLASRQPDRERARRALGALFPDGPPDAASLPNKRLAKQVNEWLEANGQPSVGQRTIQRAAGRP
jgi:hypothetical protein